MQGPATGELEDLYRRAGVRSRELPADYLGTQLECAAYLQRRGDPPAAALRQELWDRHLRRWVPRFAADLQRHSGLALYRELGARLAALFPARARPDDV